MAGHAEGGQSRDARGVGKRCPCGGGVKEALAAAAAGPAGAPGDQQACRIKSDRAGGHRGKQRRGVGVRGAAEPPRPFAGAYSGLNRTQRRQQRQRCGAAVQGTLPARETKHPHTPRTCCVHSGYALSSARCVLGAAKLGEAGGTAHDHMAAVGRGGVLAILRWGWSGLHPPCHRPA